MIKDGDIYMYSFSAYLRDKFFTKRIDAEIDEYGNISSFEFDGDHVGVKYSTKNKRALERRHYYTTGVHTLGTTYPRPYGREELLSKEYKHRNWYTKNATTIFFTILAIVIDAVCYYNLLEMAKGNNPVGFMDIIAAIGAAVAIDLLPIFFAHNLHRNSLMKNLEHGTFGKSFKFKMEKKVLQIFTVFNAILFVAIVVLMCVTRLKDPKISPSRPEFWINLIISLIPLATSMVCFILGYLSYNPIKRKLKELNEIRLFLQENINESNAMLEELKSQPNYYESLKRQDDLLYDSAYEMIEKIGNCYRSYTRLKIVPILNSPADTTDLTARGARKVYKKIKFPLYFDTFYLNLYGSGGEGPDDDDD